MQYAKVTDLFPWPGTVGGGGHHLLQPRVCQRRDDACGRSMFLPLRVHRRRGGRVKQEGALTAPELIRITGIGQDGFRALLMPGVGLLLAPGHHRHTLSGVEQRPRDGGPDVPGCAQDDEHPTSRSTVEMELS